MQLCIRLISGNVGIAGIDVIVKSILYWQRTNIIRAMFQFGSIICYKIELVYHNNISRAIRLRQGWMSILYVEDASK